MAEKLKFDLVSPERLLMSEDVDQVTVPGAEGEFGVGAGHGPVMATLRPGVLDVINEGSEQRFFVRGGFAEVTAEGLTILAEKALDLAGIDAAALDQEIQNAEEDVADAKSDAVREDAVLRRDKLKELRAAL